MQFFCCVVPLLGNTDYDLEVGYHDKTAHCVVLIIDDEVNFSKFTAKY